MPTRSLRLDAVQVVPVERGRVGDPVGARAEDGAQHDGVARWRGDRSDVETGRAVGLRADGSTSPACSGGGPSPESVSVLRDPSTGATSMPAADGEVGAQPGRRRPEAQDLLRAAG